MENQGAWQKPRLIVFGTATELTRGKFAHGNDAFCGSVPDIFCPPKFPPVPGDPSNDANSSMDAVVQP